MSTTRVGNTTFTNVCGPEKSLEHDLPTGMIQLVSIGYARSPVVNFGRVAQLLNDTVLGPVANAKSAFGTHFDHAEAMPPPPWTGNGASQPWDAAYRLYDTTMNTVEVFVRRSTRTVYARAYPPTGNASQVTIANEFRKALECNVSKLLLRALV